MVNPAENDAKPDKQSDKVVKMMKQFEVFHGMGQSVITIIDTSRYDAFYGFRRVIAIIN